MPKQDDKNCVNRRTNLCAGLASVVNSSDKVSLLMIPWSLILFFFVLNFISNSYSNNSWQSLGSRCSSPCSRDEEKSRTTCDIRSYVSCFILPSVDWGWQSKWTFLALKFICRQPSVFRYVFNVRLSAINPYEFFKGILAKFCFKTVFLPDFKKKLEKKHGLALFENN